MNYTFSFFKETDFKDLIDLVLKAYAWEDPAVGLSRLEFCRGLHPAFTGYAKAWEHTVGMYRDASDGHLVACVWNEGNYDGDVFFLFDTKERAQEVSLLQEMINYSKMFAVGIPESHMREFNLNIPEWNHTLMKIGKEIGLTKTGWADHHMIYPFTGKKLDVKLPEGYTISDGHSTPAFYLANVHRMAFGYGSDSTACEHGEEAFEGIRTMPHYDPELELCILDPMGRPVAIANIWYDPRMPYCELEPLGVVWWERRKGLGTAILHEAANRVMSKYPKCTGMLGGDQPFYSSIGYQTVSEIWPYHWEKKVPISWEPESKEQNFADEMKWNES